MENMNLDDFNLMIFSPYNKEKLTCEISYKDNLLCEISQENDELT